MASFEILHALPLPTPSHTLAETTRKRKRKGKHLAEHDTAVRHDSEPESPADDAEYTAIITPDERAQRRLAGQPLNVPPPGPPFPHASLPPSILPVSKPPHHDTTASLSATNQASTSLQLQHLSALTTVLHKCLQTRDYSRASRAFSLILHTQIRGKFIDLRHGGLWGIGAELLLRHADDGSAASISRDGFRKAKTFYDRLALQHPWNRTWPMATNAQDFKLAMLGLWICHTCQQTTRMQQAAKGAEASDNEESGDHDLQAKRYELVEAESIAREMDALMSTVPFIDDKELIRLRAHVALWCADLSETVESIQADLESNTSLQEQQMEQAWLEAAEPGSLRPGPANVSSQKAADARKMASALFVKLRGNAEDRRSDLDENMADDDTEISRELESWQ